MKEVTTTTIICGIDNTPCVRKKDDNSAFYECSSGHKIRRFTTQAEQICPHCMNSEYLVLRTLTQSGNMDFVYLCSNPYCQRYRISLSFEDRLASFFISKYNRVFMLDLRDGKPKLIFRKYYRDDWLVIRTGERLKQLNRYIRLFFFKVLAINRIKISNGKFVRY